MLNAPKDMDLNTTPDHDGLHENYCVHCMNSQCQRFGDNLNDDIMEQNEQTLP
jgi:hypothetical protein